MNRQALAVSAALVCVATSASAMGPRAQVDTTVTLATPERRWAAIEWSPVALLLGRVSLNVVVVPVSHHALVLSPFYVSSRTIPISIYDDSGAATVLPTQSFVGFGGELGYRYYFGQEGPRGVFLGPSLLLGGFNATAANASTTQYALLGGAADVGIQALVADRISLSLGAGLQFTATTASIPNQQFPANVHANGGFRPRLLAAIGCAF